VLFLAPRYPLPATRGDQLRVVHLVRALSERAEVRLLAFGDGAAPEIAGVPSTRVARGVLPAVEGNLAERSPLLPLQVRLYLDYRLRRVVRRALDEFRPDVLHVTLARMWPYASDVPAGVHVHLDLIDSLSLNMQTRAASSGTAERAVLSGEAALMRRYEEAATLSADSATVVSEQDRTVPGLERATVLPNGVDIDSIPFSDPADRPRALTFFGNLGYFHNVEPARFLATEVLPLVTEAEPGVRLRLVGARPAATVRRLAELDGVELHPDVADMGAELHRAAVAVLPMFSGSGMKNKVLEAFCAGLPVVTNAIGIAGIEGAEAGEHYLRAEGAEDLAAACVRLLREPQERSRLAARGLELARANYSWQSRADSLLELYRSSRG